MTTEKAKNILFNHLNEHTIFNIKIQAERNKSNNFFKSVLEKTGDDLKKEGETVEKADIKKLFYDRDYQKLFDDNSKLVEDFVKNLNQEQVDENLYGDLTEGAKSIFFKYLSSNKIEEYSKKTEENLLTFKIVFINLLRELKEKNEKVKGAHIVNRMLEKEVNPSYWNDQLSAVKSLIEDMEGKKQEALFDDEELKQLASEIQMVLPTEVSKEQIQKSVEAQKKETQYSRFIKMQLNVSTQLRGFEGNVLKKALEESGKEEKLKQTEALLKNQKEADTGKELQSKIQTLRNLIESEKSLNTFLQELATINSVDHEKVSIVKVEGEVEGKKYKFPALKVTFKIDAETLKKHLKNNVYSELLTPYSIEEKNNGIEILNTLGERELVFNGQDFTFNLDIEPGKRLARHAERLSALKKLIQ
ncbi:MAG: hypothetical protein M1594_02525 [Candidatus Marsarchaeota archaeon]|nr:hypothetical protein [Patescibacteria group bacterium]MCL5011746.1 hypothetical protein [Candidatus Marsarchaeota archaeon]